MPLHNLIQLWIVRRKLWSTHFKREKIEFFFSVLGTYYVELFLLSGCQAYITVLKYLLKPLHLLWYLSSVKGVSILSTAQAGFRQYWVTELGVRAPSSQQRTVTTEEKQVEDPHWRQTKGAKDLALSWTLCFLRQSEGSYLISAHVLFSDWVKHCLAQQTCWTLVLFFLLGSCLVLPDQAELKQKSPVLKKEDCPQWKHLFVFDVTPAQLQQSCLHLTLWDQSTFGSHDQFLGGAKLGASKFFIFYKITFN